MNINELGGQYIYPIVNSLHPFFHLICCTCQQSCDHFGPCAYYMFVCLLTLLYYSVVYDKLKIINDIKTRPLVANT